MLSAPTTPFLFVKLSPKIYRIRDKIPGFRENYGSGAVYVKRKRDYFPKKIFQKTATSKYFPETPTQHIFQKLHSLENSKKSKFLKFVESPHGENDFLVEAGGTIRKGAYTFNFDAN